MLAALAALAQALPVAWLDWLDWRPSLALDQPWRVVSAAFVHWTPLHLVSNLAGCVVLALLGWRAGLGGRAALAALICLPLTQLGLLLRPDLVVYGGLSGVLHGLAVIAALSLLARSGRERWTGAAILLGLAIKLAMEHPLGAALRQTPDFDFSVAPFAHLSGAMSGALAWRLTMRPSRNLPRSPYGT